MLHYHHMKMNVGVEIRLHLNTNHYTDWSSQAPGTADKCLSLQFSCKYLKV
jgi:hypothetical protein